MNEFTNKTKKKQKMGFLPRLVGCVAAPGGGGNLGRHTLTTDKSLPAGWSPGEVEAAECEDGCKSTAGCGYRGPPNNRPDGCG